MVHAIGLPDVQTMNSWNKKKISSNQSWRRKNNQSQHNKKLHPEEKRTVLKDIRVYIYSLNMKNKTNMCIIHFGKLYEYQCSSLLYLIDGFDDKKKQFYVDRCTALQTKAEVFSCQSNVMYKTGRHRNECLWLQYSNWRAEKQTSLC